MAESPPGDARLWLERWRARLAEGDLIPEDEARLVVTSVLDDLGGEPGHLDGAGRAWGRAHRSVSEMVGRLSSFREALVANGVDDPLRMHRALDQVTASATEEVLHRLERASRTDALTGVGNRRALDETLSAALSAAARQGHEVTVVAVDLDGLKRINDTEGHAAGDAALLSLVRALYSTLRDEDVILLPFTSVGTADLLMERIRAVGAPAFTWGAAGYPTDGPDARAVVEAADRELYRRRHDRAPAMALSARPAPAPAPRAQRGVLGWIWIPAAGVLVASLVATLISAAAGSGPVIARRFEPPPATRAGYGGGSTPSTAAPGGVAPNSPASSAGPPGGASAAMPAAAATVGAPPGASPVSVGSPGGGSGRSGGGTAPTGPPGGAPPPSGGGGGSPPGQGGVLAILENTLSPVPVVGGSNGLVAVIGQVVA